MGEVSWKKYIEIGEWEGLERVKQRRVLEGVEEEESVECFLMVVVVVVVVCVWCFAGTR